MNETSYPIKAPYFFSFQRMKSGREGSSRGWREGSAGSGGESARGNVCVCFQSSDSSVPSERSRTVPAHLNM